MAAADNMAGFDDEGGGRHDAVDRPARAGAARSAGLSRDGFLGHVDACVRQLAAWLGANDAERARLPAAQRCRAELWQWLHDDAARLDDGTPIDFALFDVAIQRVGERLPRRGLPGQDKLLQAACLLAELAYAPALTSIPAS